MDKFFTNHFSMFHRGERFVADTRHLNDLEVKGKYFTGNEAKERLRDLISGAISGAAAKVLEFPFDTVKVLQQSHPKFNNIGPVAVAITTVKQHGWTSLFKGMSAPTLGATFENALVFSAYGQAKHTIGVHEGSWAAPWRYFAAGGASGVVAGFVLTPIELIKVRLQTQSARLRAGGVAEGAYRGPIDLVKAEWAAGGLRAMFRGLAPTLGREICGNAMWFGVYELAVRTSAERLDYKSRAEVPLYVKGFCGALGGLSFWLIPYPFDTIKSVMQAESTSHSRGAVTILKRIVREEGLQGVYRGLPITLVRAAPEHFLLFYLFEATDALLLEF